MNGSHKLSKSHAGGEIYCFECDVCDYYFLAELDRLGNILPETVVRVRGGENVPHVYTETVSDIDLTMDVI